MKYLSVCSGIEAATVAWHPLGWEPVAFSEIEPFPSAVLAHHYPQVPNLGDMTKHKEWNLGTIDLLVGGTPCQSFSVAGLRKGLDDPRGNLMLTYLAIADRNRPTWLVWENVPGVLSSNGGKDFGTFLGGLGELGYGFAYRVLDAQYFGVAQRRRRVFVVGYLGDWRPAAAVLFERESLRGDPAPSRKKGEATARVVAPSLTASNDPSRSPQSSEITQQIYSVLQATNIPSYGIPGNWIGRQPENGGNSTQFMEEVAPCLTIADKHGVVHTYSAPEIGHIVDDEVASTITKHTSGGGETQNPAYVAQPIPISADKHGVAHTFDMKQHHNPQASDTVQLTTKNSAFVRGDTPLVAQPMAFTQNTRDEVRWINGDGRIAGALAAESGMKQQTYLAQPFQQTADCLTAAYGTNWNGNASANNGSLFASQGMAVRRLTPVECERLQGFPDNYTNIPWRKADQSPDGPRYKALGNSMAVPVMAWIGKRIAEYEQQAISG